MLQRTSMTQVKVTDYTNLIVVLQHLSDYSDLWMVVLDRYYPDAWTMDMCQCLRFAFMFITFTNIKKTPSSSKRSFSYCILWTQFKAGQLAVYIYAQRFKAQDNQLVVSFDERKRFYVSARSSFMPSLSPDGESCDALAYTHSLNPGRSGNWYQTLAFFFLEVRSLGNILYIPVYRVWISNYLSVVYRTCCCRIY